MSQRGDYIDGQGRTVEGLSRQFGWLWTIQATGETFLEDDPRAAVRRLREAEKRLRPLRMEFLRHLLGTFFTDSADVDRFLIHFAATVLSVPETRVVDKSLRDRRIAELLQKDPSKPSRRNIASFFGVKLRDLSPIYWKVTGQRLSHHTKEWAARHGK